jgi:HSP20 family protein
MSSLLRFSEFEPFNQLLALQRELERALEHPQLADQGLAGHGLFPPMNVFRDKEGSLVVRLEVPGVRPDALNIEAQGRSLRISAKRAADLPEKATFHRRERQAGDFSRVIQLPDDVDPAKVEASYKHGVLSVKVAKREEAKPRQISIQAH